MSLLIVRSETETCGVPLDAVTEVMRPLPVAPVRGAPPSVVGVARVRGEPLPVICLSRLLGDPAPESFGRFLSVRSGTTRIVLAVREIVGVSPAGTWRPAELPALVRRARPEVVSAIAMLDAQLLLLLDAARVLPREFTLAVAE